MLVDSSERGSKTSKQADTGFGHVLETAVLHFSSGFCFFKSTIFRVLTFKLIFSDCEPLTVFFPMFCDVIDFDINFDIDFLYNI